MSLQVAVVGQGVAGVSTALALLEQIPGVRVTLFADRPFEETCSFGPAGYLEVIVPEHKRWAAATFERFAKLEREVGPVSGVKYVSGFSQHDDRTELEKLEAMNAEIVHNFRWMMEREMRQLFVEPSKYAVHYSSYCAAGRDYVPWMREQLARHGAHFVRREIRTLEELGEDGFEVVINCAGLHGGRLARDDEGCEPIRGLAFELAVPGFKHFSMRDFGTFLLPLDHSVIAGTVRQYGRYDRTVTEEDRQEVLSKVYRLHPALRSAEIVSEWCGLRPGRSCVRLEKQAGRTTSGLPFHIIHNYGHGSNGFTLSWGCAVDVVELVRAVFVEKESVHCKL